MSLKPLTAEGRFELSDFFESLTGKVWCFVNVVGEHYPARLGIAVANETGYHPIPEHWAHADSYSEMDAHADALNVAEGIDVASATRIVISTMGGQPIPTD